MFKALIVLSLIAAGVYAANDQSKVIYGDDDRVDFYQVDSKVQALASSTAAMISPSYLTNNNGKYTLKASTLATAMKVCPEERFASQPVAANCSGFLVKDNWIVTAGHCITSVADCSKYLWVFDYALTSKSKKSMTFDKSSVYKCKRIISRTQDNETMNDYALIELDRSVTGKTPLKTMKNMITEDTQIFVVGHPSGLPIKIAGGARVKSLDNYYFTGNLDTYGGNSGSAVFNATTGEVAGILVRGATDYVYDNTRGCRVSNVLSNDNGQEESTFINNIKELQTL